MPLLLLTDDINDMITLGRIMTDFGSMASDSKGLAFVLESKGDKIHIFKRKWNTSAIHRFSGDTKPLRHV